VVASILGAAQAQGANWIGNQTLLGGDFNTSGNVNEFAHEFAHAIVGCAAGVAGASAAGSGTSTGQGCSAGALGAVVGELSAQFYGGTDPNQTIAFAQMMGGIAAAAAGLGAEGVSIAANTGANAAQNNYMAHYDTYEKDLKACQQNPGGVNCGAILSLTEGTNARYLGMTQGGYRVAANMGKDGAASYTVVSPDGETMVMQPTEWAYFSQMTSGQQATIFSASQWQLDFNSMTEYGRSGDTTAAMANYGHMFTTPSYLEDAGLGLFSGIGLGEVASLLRAPVKALGDVANSGAANRALHEAYKNELRAAMDKPAVTDPALSSIVDKLYRPNATVGSGSTAAAVRQELATGQSVGGAFHSQKASESIVKLQRWLNQNPTASSGDRAAAENLIIDMKNALEGR
jgi:hypothetical protein